MKQEAIDRYSSPEALAGCTDVPVKICRLLFLAMEGDPEGIKLLRGPRGDSELWEQRNALSWVMRSYLNASFPEIGRALNRDHSVSVRSFARAQKLRGLNTEFRDLCCRYARIAVSQEMKRPRRTFHQDVQDRSIRSAMR